MIEILKGMLPMEGNEKSTKKKSPNVVPDPKDVAVMNEELDNVMQEKNFPVDEVKIDDNLRKTIKEHAKKIMEEG